MGWGANMCDRQAVVWQGTAVVALWLLVACPSVAARFVVTPVAPSPGVSQAESDVFYQAVITALGQRKDVQIVERAKTKQILDEMDLGLGMKLHNFPKNRG